MDCRSVYKCDNYVLRLLKPFLRPQSLIGSAIRL